jgi:mycothiol system anti-sigma-R factor
VSCGGPHDTDCREVIETVYLYLDGEQNEHDRHRIREHLDECAPCLRQYGIEQEVKALVARCCGGEVAPARLRESVLVRLREVRVTTASLEYRAD